MTKRRPVRLDFTATAPEAEAIRRASDACGRSVADFTREAALRAAAAIRQTINVQFNTEARNYVRALFMRAASGHADGQERLDTLFEELLTEHRAAPVAPSNIGPTLQGLLDDVAAERRRQGLGSATNGSVDSRDDGD